MAYPHTPRRLGARPALHPTASSPNLSLNASRNIARQASLSALVGAGGSPSNRMGADGKDIDVGDTVDVPGGMIGVVKFVGSIRGKQGVFAGVELNREYAARGKNDGAVDGYAYTTLDVCAHTDVSPVHNTSIPLSLALASSCPYTAHRSASRPTRLTSHLSLPRPRTTTTLASRPRRSPASVRIPRRCHCPSSPSRSAPAPVPPVPRGYPQQYDPHSDQNLPIARSPVQPLPGAAD
jgi:hypothetical protein